MGEPAFIWGPAPCDTVNALQEPSSHQSLGLASVIYAVPRPSLQERLWIPAEVAEEAENSKIQDTFESYGTNQDERYRGSINTAILFGGVSELARMKEEAKDDLKEKVKEGFKELRIADFARDLTRVCDFELLRCYPI